MRAPFRVRRRPNLAMMLRAEEAVKLSDDPSRCLLA